ncbi:MAG: SDR family NAD(P)-dependent oxidoreductase [Bacteroidota bacterium]
MTHRSTALVTGASSGIGKELAREHARHGGDLILVARRNEKLEALKQELQEAHPDPTIHVLAMDLSEPGSATRLSQHMSDLGLTVDILINNAGFGVFGPFLETDRRAVEQMLQLNITTLTELTRLLAPAMVRSGYGRVLNVASTAAFQPGPNFSTYYASKAYVLSFSEAIAHELSGTGVTVTTLCPGPTESEFQERAEMGTVALFDRFPLPTSAEVAAYGYRKMIQGKRVAIHGVMNRITSFFARITPRALVLPVVKRLQQNRN